MAIIGGGDDCFENGCGLVTGSREVDDDTNVMRARCRFKRQITRKREHERSNRNDDERFRPRRAACLDEDGMGTCTYLGDAPVDPFRGA